VIPVIHQLKAPTLLRDAFNRSSSVFSSKAVQPHLREHLYYVFNQCHTGYSDAAAFGMEETAKQAVVSEIYADRAVAKR
jgi:hypothetical protein